MQVIRDGSECVIVGCATPNDESGAAKGLCKAHYAQARRGTLGKGYAFTEGRGDNYFPGRGVVKCFICGDPVRDHAIAPCPRYDGGVFHSRGKVER